MRHAGFLLAIMLAGSLANASAGERESSRWFAGLYSFSDELGGFRITGISGIGTREDPVVLVQEFEEASPVTLVIRSTGLMRRFPLSGDNGNGFLHMRVLALNNSGHAWVEFEFELQEILGKASVFGDGLSFDQRRTGAPNISSDSYAEFNRNFEPYDRLRFRSGRVDPLATAGFSFLITDFTPVSEFYLVQDPRIPSS